MLFQSRSADEMKQTEHMEPYFSEQPKHNGTMSFLYGKQAREFLEHGALAEKELSEAARKFIEEKLNKIPKRKSPSKVEIKNLEDSLIGASVRVLVGSVLNQKPSDFDGPIMVGKTNPPSSEEVIGRSAARYAPWVHKARFDVVWPELWSKWQKAHKTKTEQYVFPTVISDVNRGLGKKAGEEHGLPYKLRGDQLVVIPQKNQQLHLNFGSKLSDISSLGPGERNQTLNDLLAMEGYGPEVTKNWHYVFYATRHSKDGTFYFNPAEWLDLFGHKRTGGGKNRQPRHTSSSVKRARNSFKAFADIELKGTLFEMQVGGKLLHNRELEFTVPTESGGVKKQRWGVNELLWAVFQKSGAPYVLFTPELVNAGEVHVFTNDKMIRILEVLFTYARINPGKQEYVLSFKELAHKTNIYSAKVEPKKARKDLWKIIEIAQSQGKLRNTKKVQLKNGLPGVSYELPEELKQNMRKVAELREKHALKKQK